MLTHQEILAIYESGPEAVISVIQRLETIIEKQAIRITELEERVKFVESRLNQNNRNSSKTLSTDFVKEKLTYSSLRKKSSKKSGGQEGHSGTTLEMVSDSEQVIEIL